jgi:hypothetical protein
MLGKTLLIGGFGALVFYYTFRPEIPLVSEVLDTAQDTVLKPLDYTGNLLKFTARGLRNNNPGNIRWNAANNWRGQVRDDGGYIVFDTMENGTRALALLLKNYIRSGRNTIRTIITSWAPVVENDTDAYVRAVMRATGFSSSQTLTDNEITLVALMGAITRHENGFNPLSRENMIAGYRNA